MPENISERTTTDRAVAEMIRAACLRAAVEAYEDASMRGVCHEGAWECAVGAIRSLDLQAVLRDRKQGH